MSLEFLFENDDFPDTDSKASDERVFDGHTEDVAAVRIEVKESDVREEVDEGDKVMKII